MKFSKYNYAVDMDWGILLFNTFRSTYAQIHKKEELDKFRNLLETNIFDPNDEMVQVLYNRGYIVDDDVNEYKKTKKEIEDYYNNDKELYIMVYVTENCNFRCVYCPEKHVNRKFSNDNWNNLYKYIETSVENGIYNKVCMAFFGGEPLLEKNSIIKFLDKLVLLNNKYPDVEFCHYMTTNGYLLTPDVYDELTKRNLRWYQITLDGFAEEHNQTRPLAGGGGSWDRIVENFKYINEQDDNAFISLRVNIGKTNIKRMREYIDWLKKTFNNKKFNIELNTIGKFSDNVSDDLVVTSEDKEIEDFTYDILADVPMYHMLTRLGITCRFARKNYYTISVDGKITKCDDAYNGDYDSENIGILSDKGLVFNKDMPEYSEGYEKEYCKNCKIYPLCAARRCPYNKVFGDNKLKDCFHYDNDKQVFIEGLGDEKMIRILKNSFKKLKVKN